MDLTNVVSIRKYLVLLAIPLALSVACGPPDPTPDPPHTTPPPSPTPVVSPVLNGLPPGAYACRVDGAVKLFESNLAITAAGMYSGGYQGGSQQAPIAYDPATGRVTFKGGDYFSDPGTVSAHHFVGHFPSDFAGDPAGTILLSELAGYPGDSDVAPSVEGSSSGLWHCTPTFNPTPTSPPVPAPVPPEPVPPVPVPPLPEPPAPTPVAPPLSRTVVMSVPFGVYENSTHSQALHVSSTGAYSLGPASNPDSGQLGGYQVASSSSITFDTGPYAGLTGALYPNYKGSTRMYIDVVFEGVRTSFQYVRPS